MPCIAKRDLLFYFPPWYNLQFMRDFASVWKWTVEEKKGIFSPSPERGTLKLNQHPPPIPVKQHLLLIKVCT